MAANATSTYDDRLESFTDREDIIERFRHLLEKATPECLSLLPITGNSGTGKTLLIQYLSERICSSRGWKTDTITFSSTPNFNFIARWLEGALQACVAHEHIESYRADMKQYRQDYVQYRDAVTVNTPEQTITADDRAHLHHVSQTMTVNIQADELEKKREQWFRECQTAALLKLAEHSTVPLCLFLDVYEYLAEDKSGLVEWFWNDMLPALEKRMPQPLVVVTCGWKAPDLPSLRLENSIFKLDDFKRDDIRSYLHHKEVFAASTSEEEALLHVFHELSRGHPLLLSLAVTHFYALAPAERTAQKMHTDTPWIDEEAQAAFIQKRLLSCLPEPYNTLLRYGPIMRTFDMPALQALLDAVAAITEKPAYTIDEQQYQHFIQYPFINRPETQGQSFANSRLTFHDLVRRVQLHALHEHSEPVTKQINSALSEYYGTLADKEAEKLAERAPGHYPSLSDIPEGVLRYGIAWLYHSLQVEERQEDAFKTWNEITSSVITLHRRPTEKLLEVVRQQAEDTGQAESLLEVVRQLNTEKIAFFDSTKLPYGLYYIMHAYYLERETRYDNALEELKKAIELFNQLENSYGVSICLNNAARLYIQSGNLRDALDCMEHALEIFRASGDPADIATGLNNLGAVYQQLGLPEQALPYLLQALPYLEQAGNPIQFALTQSNIGLNYQSRGEQELAESYFKMASGRFKSAGDNLNYALTLNNIGLTYQYQDRAGLGLEYYQQALDIYEKIGDAGNIAMVTHNIGSIYELQGKLDEALSSYQRALRFYEQAGNPLTIIQVLQRIVAVFQSQQQWDEALKTLARLLQNYEQMENPLFIANTHAQIGATHQLKEDFQAAFTSYARALELFEQVEGDDISKQVQMGSVLVCLGDIHRRWRQWLLALQRYERALSIVERIRDTASIAPLQNSIAEVHRAQRHWEEALQCYLKALAVAQPAQASHFYNAIGEMYQAQRKWQEAFDTYSYTITLSESENDDTTLAATFYHMGELQREQGLWNLALDYHRQALNLREQLGSRPAIAQSLDTLGIIHSRQGDTKEALQLYERARQLYEQESDTRFIAIAYNNIGNLYSIQGKMESALDYHQRALALRRKERERNPLALATSLNNLGEIYRCQGRLQEALKYQHEALTCWQELGNPEELATALNNIAGIYDAMGDSKRAIEYLLQSLEQCDHVENPAIIATTLNNLATLYHEQGDQEQALKNYQSALKLFQESGNIANMALLHYNIGSLHQKQHNMQQAIEAYKKSLNMYEQLGPGFLTYVANVFNALADCYQLDGKQTLSKQFRQQAQRSQAKYAESVP